MAQLDVADLVNRFSYHPPTGGKVETHQNVRDVYRKFALTIAPNLPTSREKSLAITALEESLMWANAAIARNPEA